ncbi:MAG: sulfatase [Xanthomonadales bacterium]|nr:sulfatase [Xanthomonadales bacterium]
MKKPVFYLLLCSLVLAACQQEVEVPEQVQDNVQQQPNILWIVSEDNSPWLGSYGDELATTPRLDALASQSIRYTRAYSNAPVCAPSRNALITGAYPIAYGTEHMRSSYKIPAGVRFYPEYLREAGYYTTNNAKKDYNTVDRPQAWDESSGEAHYRNRAEGQPFFHIFNFSTTHESRLHRGSIAQNHDPAAVELYPYHPDTPEARNDYAVYYDRLEELDGQVGQVLDELAAEGLADSTIVFYYADHGGVVAGTKRFVTEDGLHVPLFIRVPEQFRHFVGYEPTETVDRPVSFVDLPATLLRLAGIDKPEYMVGQSVLHQSNKPYVFAYGGRMDERRNLVRSVSDGQYRYTRNYLPHRPYGRRLEYLWNAPLMQSWAHEYEAGNLNEVQSAFFEPRAAEELYDVVNDPHQTVNLVGQPELAGKLGELSGALTGWQVEQRDAGLVPEPMLLELDRQGVIRDYVTSAAYPVAEIVQLAQLAGERDAGNLAEFVEQLQSGHPVKTYWAATGLLLLGNAAQSALPVIENTLDKVEPWTGIVLAELMIGLETKEPATRYLGEVLGSENLMVRLQAMETIVDTRLLDPSLKQAIAALIPEDPRDRPYDGRMARYVMKLYAAADAAGEGNE